MFSGKVMIDCFYPILGYVNDFSVRSVSEQSLVLSGHMGKCSG